MMWNLSESLTSGAFLPGVAILPAWQMCVMFFMVQTLGSNWRRRRLFFWLKLFCLCYCLFLFIKRLWKEPVHEWGHSTRLKLGKAQANMFSVYCGYCHVSSHNKVYNITRSAWTQFISKLVSDIIIIEVFRALY